MCQRILERKLKKDWVRFLDRIRFGGVAIFSMLMSFFVSLQIEIQALVVFMVIDYITGIFVALFFKNSSKTATGAYSSGVGFKGLVKKVEILLLLVALFYLDKITASSVFMTLGAIGFCVNEIASILENAGLMGIKLPKAFENALDVLRNKQEQ